MPKTEKVAISSEKLDNIFKGEKKEKRLEGKSLYLKD